MKPESSLLVIDIYLIPLRLRTDTLYLYVPTKTRLAGIISPAPMLSQAIEDYLKTIYKLHEGGAVSTTEIARKLEVSSASVTNMVKRMARMGLVTHQAYRGVTLTDSGTKIALEIIRHHRLLETYLREIMGYDWETMHAEAEQLEHHISEEFEDRLDEMLGYPTHDPHGDPIPSRDGNIHQTALHPLTSFEAGKEVRVHRLPDSDPAFLSRLETLGILPNAHLTVVDQADELDTVTVRIGADEFDLHRAEAELILGSAAKPAAAAD